MAEKKKSILEEAFEDMKGDLKREATERFENFLFGSTIDAMDVIGDSSKKFIGRLIFKDKPIPERYKKAITGSTGSNGRENYSSYYYSPPRTVRDVDAVKEDATKVRAIFKDTKDEAQAMIDKIIEKIDNSPNNMCTVGNLYSWNGIPSSSMMLWKYGWNERDKSMFDVKEVLTGTEHGRWILVLPTPHRVA